MQVSSSQYCVQNPAFGQIKLTNNAELFRAGALTHYENEFLDKLIKQHKNIPDIITVDAVPIIVQAKNSIGKIKDFYVEAMSVRVRDKVFSANGFDERDNFKQIAKAVEYFKNLTTKS